MKINEKFISPLLMWFIVINGIIIIYHTIPTKFIFSPSNYSLIILIPVIIIWLFFLIRSVIVHRKAPYSTSKITNIITWDVYSISRHPIYTADMLLLWSVFIYYPSVAMLVISVWSTIVILFWMNLEEKSLVNKFGQEYIEYQKCVPKIIPHTFKMKKKS